MDRLITLFHMICDNVKPMIMFFIGAIVSMFSPIQDVLYVLSLAFVFNIFTGILTDIHVNKKQFSIKKAFEAIIQLTFFIALIWFTHNVAATLNDVEAGRYAVKGIVYIVLYFYTSNILRNGNLIFPNNSAIAFMYEVFTTQILIRLKNYFGLINSKTEQNENSN